MSHSRRQVKKRRAKSLRRLSTPELERIVREGKPELARLSSLVAFAERELQTRNWNEQHSGVAGSPGAAEQLRATSGVELGDGVLALNDDEAWASRPVPGRD